MDRLEIDDVKHALTQLMAFYDKELTEQQWRFWWSVLKHRPVKHVLKALARYMGEGKYAPRPAHIMEIVERYPKNSTQEDNPAPPVKCPDEIRLAWCWYIGMSTKDTNVELYQGHLGAAPDLADRYLHIVNHEAHRLNQPEAIGAQYKLKEVWG